MRLLLSKCGRLLDPRVVTRVVSVVLRQSIRPLLLERPLQDTSLRKARLHVDMTTRVCQKPDGRSPRRRGLKLVLRLDALACWRTRARLQRARGTPCG